MPCDVVRVAVADGPNLEARARDARRAVLPAGALTGHTADDRAATLLVNLLRGAGRRRAGGDGSRRRRARSSTCGAPRPSRCARHTACVPVVDPTNDDRRFVRNRVRDELLPLMADIAGRDVVPLLVRTATVLADDAALAAGQADGLDADRRPGAGRRARRPLARRVVRRWLTGIVDGGSGYAARRGDRGAGARGRAAASAGRARSPAASGSNVTASGCASGDAGALVSPDGMTSGIAGVEHGDDVAGGDGLMATRLRGRWALGITPRNFTWILKDKLAICERPGGYGENHRRVRRQEEIIWIRENGFGCVISIIPAPHNLHNYDELGVTSRHRPFNGEELEPWLKAFFKELNELLKSNVKVIVHGEEVGDRIVGIMGGYIRWAGLVDDDTQAITVTERLAGRQLDPFARNVILLAPKLR